MRKFLVLLGIVVVSQLASGEPPRSGPRGRCDAGRIYMLANEAQNYVNSNANQVWQNLEQIKNLTLECNGNSNPQPPHTSPPSFNRWCTVDYGNETSDYLALFSSTNLEHLNFFQVGIGAELEILEETVISKPGESYKAFKLKVLSSGIPTAATTFPMAKPGMILYDHQSSIYARCH